MVDVSRLSYFSLYYFVKEAAAGIAAEKTLLDAMMIPAHGEGWAQRLLDDCAAYRAALDHLLKELAETTATIAALKQMSDDVSDWRTLATGLARNATPKHKQVLLEAAGWGLGRAERPKEIKNLLMTLKSRVEVHANTLRQLGMDEELLDLPARVLAALESGSGDVAREKAEDALARAEVKDLRDRIVPVLTTAWRSAELIPVQARLLARKKDAPEALVAEHQERAKKAAALDERLEREVAESRIQTKKKAAEGGVPVELVNEDDEPELEVEKPAA